MGIQAFTPMGNTVTFTAATTAPTPAPIPMYWVPCADNITPNGFYYTGYGFVAY